MTTYNNFISLRKTVNYLKVEYDILSSFMYCKYFLTEAILARDESYVIYDKTYNSHISYIEKMLVELRKYREIIYHSLGEFSEPMGVGADFYEYTQNKELLLRVIVAGEHQQKFSPFWSSINQIPTSIFSVAKIDGDINEIHLGDRNVYDLMMNLINDYFIGMRDTIEYVIKFIKKNCKVNFLLILVFILSLIFTIISIFALYKILSQLLIMEQGQLILY